MKPFLIILICLFTTLTAYGQQPEYPDSGFTNKTEAKNLTVNGLKEGKWVEYLGDDDSTNTIDSTATYFRLVIYKSGKYDGIVRDYFNFVGTGADGVDGDIYCECTYIKGEKNGICRIYNKNHSLRDEIPYTDNYVNGIMKEYFENGGIRNETRYTNGRKRAIKSFDENGNEIKQ